MSGSGGRGVVGISPALVQAVEEEFAGVFAELDGEGVDLGEVGVGDVVCTGGSCCHGFFGQV